MLKQDRLPLQKSTTPCATAALTTEAKKKTGTTNRFAEGSRGPRSFDNDDRSSGAKKEFKGGAANYKRVKRRNAEDIASTSGEMRLNRFLSHAGICNRREADDLIAAGLVQVNGKVIVTMGYKVQPSDEVKYNGSLIKSEKKKYLVLNKPKGFITSITDKKAKKTVEELVGNACRERLYPVGSMDRTSTGVLLFTNDVDLAKKMAHPKNGAVQIISVVLDKPLQKTHLTAIAKGLELEDGKIDLEEIKYIDERTKREVGLRLHSGKHRIVHRIFDKFGYTIEKMDRASFAGFTKKNLSRGQWRFLDPKEIDFLKTR